MLSTVWAETVILNDGRTLKGEIVGKKGDSIYLRSEGNIYLLTRKVVEQIKNESNQPITETTYKKENFIQQGVDLNKYSQLALRSQLNEDGTLKINGAVKKYETIVDLHKITLSVAFAVLAWDYFATADDIGASFDNVSNASLKKIRSRKLINGYLLSIASVASVAFSFERVEIKASPTSLELGYKF